MCKSVFYVTRQTQSATITDKSSFSVKQTRQKYHCVKIKSFLFYWIIDTTQLADDYRYNDDVANLLFTKENRK